MVGASRADVRCGCGRIDQGGLEFGSPETNVKESAVIHPAGDLMVQLAWVLKHPKAFCDDAQDPKLLVNEIRGGTRSLPGDKASALRTTRSTSDPGSEVERLVPKPLVRGLAVNGGTRSDEPRSAAINPSALGTTRSTSEYGGRLPIVGTKRHCW